MLQESHALSRIIHSSFFKSSSNEWQMVEYIIVTGRDRNALAKYVESNVQLKAGLEYRIFCS